MGLIAADRLLLPGGVWGGPSVVRVKAGRIEAIARGASTTEAILAGGALTPGLLDLHNNGAFGVDFATAGAEGWQLALTGLARRGVTAVQPTIITAPLEALSQSLELIAAAPAGPGLSRVLGAHLEGPFLAPARRGAHRGDWLRLPTPDALAPLLHHPALRMITMAPELEGTLPAITSLAAAGVRVAIGHSDATAAQTTAAADAGARLVTHLFNAMRPFGHRDPGVPGVALTDRRLWCCLIADGHHVDPLACRLAFQAAGERIVLVTDSIPIAGTPPGTVLPFGGAPVTGGPDGVGRRADGTLSGAGIVLDEGVRRMIAAGISPAAVLHSATEAPAQALGRDDLGRIAPGAWADLVWWDESWRPRRVWIAGEEVLG